MEADNNTPPPQPDAHHAPPSHIRELHKQHQKAASSSSIIDFGLPSALSRVVASDCIPSSTALAAFTAFTSTPSPPLPDIPIYILPHIPGIQLIPNLLPPHVQKTLLHRLLFRDLSIPHHTTNLHAHYNLPPLPASQSFFDLPPSTPLRPRTDATKPLTTAGMLDRKLRWITLGGQYNWTQKKYPPTVPPLFPDDIASLVSALFGISSQAAIVNVYSPGDTLSPHRDVAEECSAPLVSLSLGCDALFLVGGDVNGVVRVRSGDAIVMSGKGRWAWHSVPKVLEGTCPEWLAEWPDERRGWMAGKRVNLNVRQMWG